MSWYIKVLKQYFDFSGRARPKEYWMFVLFNIIVSVGLGVVDGVIMAALDQPIQILGPLYSLAVLVPSLAVGVRRLHDTGKSGMWMLIAFVPCVGGFYLLFLLIQDGNPGPNEFGADPLDPESGPTAF